jgi:hypothetical protein
MTDPDLFTRVAEAARRQKLEVVRQFGDDSDESLSDLRPTTLVVRDGDLVASVIAAEGGPFSAREACYLAALFMRPDEVFVVADSRMKVMPKADLSEGPEAGELQAKWEAGERAHIQECMMIVRATRDGQPELRVFPYERKGRTVEWGAPDEYDKETSGAIPDAVADGFATGDELWPDMLQTLTAAAPEFGVEDELVLHIDRVCARLISAKGPMVMVNADESIFSNGEELVLTMAGVTKWEV